MNVVITKQFSKDVEKIDEKKIIEHIISTIEFIKTSESIEILTNIKKMQGFMSFYRIKIGNYRLGFELNKDLGEVVLKRFLHRKDIYRYFP